MGLSLLHGVVAGGTASYLQNRARAEVQNPTEEKWMTLALQVNHLLLLTTETVLSAGLPLGALGTVMQVGCALTAVALGAGLLQEAPAQSAEKEITLFTEARINKWNSAYKTGVVVASVATLALGNPVFAAGSLSMLAIDMYAKGEGKRVFDAVSKMAAIGALISYSAQACAQKGMLATMDAISAIIIMGKKLLSNLPPASEYCHREVHYIGSCDRYHWTSDSPTVPLARSSSLTDELQALGSLFTRRAI